MSLRVLLPLAALAVPGFCAEPPASPVDTLYGRFRALFDEDQPGADTLLAQLEKEFPGHARTLDARKRFDAPGKTRPGLKAPAFAVPDLERPGTPLSLDTFKGRPVLLEFWATWCPYCVADLPLVHRAHGLYKDRLEILSFSLDKRPEDVAAFRQAKQPMPWRHAFLPGMKAHPVAEAYGAAGIPKYVLVGGDGTILAAGSELRGERLELTLARLLAEDPAAAALAAVKDAVRRLGEARQAHLKAGKPAAEFRPDMAPLRTGLAEWLAAEQRPAVRQALLVGTYQLALAERKDPDAELAARLKAEVPSTAPAWALEPGLLPRFLETCFASATEADAFAREGRERHPDPSVRAGLLMAQFEANLGENDAVAKAAMEKLEREHPAYRDTAFARRLWDAQAKTPVGAVAPPFAVTNLEDPKVTFTNAAFAGKYVLIDFWASWCPPCRAELPGVHRAYARFKDKGFEILSLSWDLKPEDIAAFRAKEGTPMPWKHAYLGRGKHPLNDAYGVVGIPKPVLVGPDGKIVATDAQLRGEKLFATLEKFLGK